VERDVEAAVGRRIEWATRTLTQGDVLTAFAAHCREQLDDVEVLDAGPAHLDARWRKEASRLELCPDLAARARATVGVPTMLLGDLGTGLDALAERFASEAELRNRLALIDLARLEKISAVRSSVFVYFEWFLRDEYGVKLLPATAFTMRLVSKGIISLGFG